jgi:hypothetical protein
MFVSRQVAVVPHKDPPQVNAAAKVQSLVVEEELLRLILDLNPQVRVDAKEALRTDRPIAAEEIATWASSVAQSATNQAASVDVSGPFDATTADYGDDDNVRELIKLLPTPPATQVNPLYRERLLRFFDRYAKHRLPTVAQILRRYQGHEQSLFASLVEEYGPEPALSDHDFFHEGMPPLADGWVRVESTRGDIYYRNIHTRDVAWSRPRAGRRATSDSRSF